MTAYSAYSPDWVTCPRTARERHLLLRHTSQSLGRWSRRRMGDRHRRRRQWQLLRGFRSR